MKDKDLRNRMNKIRDSLRDISEEINNLYCAINEEAAPIKEQPDFAQHPQAVICSNKVCDYCEGNDACLACDPAKGRDAFLGRKLTAC